MLNFNRSGKQILLIPSTLRNLMPRHKEIISELLKTFPKLEMEDAELMLSVSKEETVEAGKIFVREGEINA